MLNFHDSTVELYICSYNKSTHVVMTVERFPERSIRVQAVCVVILVFLSFSPVVVHFYRVSKILINLVLAYLPSVFPFVFAVNVFSC